VQSTDGDPAGPAVLNPVAWPGIWARIRTWPVPPRWSYRDWRDEAAAHGAEACFGALRDFDPRRLVPLNAFLYGRIVEAVRTRHRQEWAYGRRSRPGEAIVNQSAPERGEPDPEFEADTLSRLQAALGRLHEADLGLIRQLFWKGRGEDDMARERGVSQQAISKRKQKILLELRLEMRRP
jgi:DNA-directed RNA polymerase specialized sigma24 family protein